MTRISIDVDIDDVLYNLSDREKQKLVEELYDDGFVQTQISTDDSNNNLLDVMWTESVTKLLNNRHMLTSEDEEIIKKISNKI
jgi:hypothetical protein